MKTFGLRTKADFCMIIQTNSSEGNLNVNKQKKISLNKSSMMKSRFFRTRFFLERNWNIGWFKNKGLKCSTEGEVRREWG